MSYRNSPIFGRGGVRLCRSAAAGFCALFMASAFFICSLPVRAESEPFEVEQSGWMSLERFDDKTERFPETQKKEEPVSEPPPEAAPATPEAAATEAKAEDGGAPKPSAPDRPISIPTMPGANSGFSVRVNSTTDDTALPPPPTKDGKPNLALPESNWHDARSAAELLSVEKGNDAKRGPLDVRLPSLPDVSVSSVPAGPATKNPRPLFPDKAKPKAVVKPKEDREAAAAIDAYKKRQMDALESDRRTLDALQAAISELGLSDKLDFSSDVSGGLAVVDKQPETGKSTPSADAAKKK